jgi:rhodanese-related sulfurtransferase
MRFLLFILMMPLVVACQDHKDFDAMARDMGGEVVPLIHPDSIPEGAIFVDIREDKEYKVSHIPGAWTQDEFENAHVASGTPVILYCSVGYRSGKYGEKLFKMGVDNVYNLYGGIFNWTNEGHEMVDEKGPTDKVHTYNKKWGKWVTKGEKVN